MEECFSPVPAQVLSGKGLTVFPTARPLLNVWGIIACLFRQKFVLGDN